MDRSAYMSVGGTWIIMLAWLGMVICSGRLAFTAWRGTQGLRAFNEKFSLFMIPKAFAHMTAFYFLIRGFLAPGAAGSKESC
jgi:hypothetical protein